MFGESRTYCNNSLGFSVPHIRTLCLLTLPLRWNVDPSPNISRLTSHLLSTAACSWRKKNEPFCRRNLEFALTVTYRESFLNVFTQSLVASVILNIHSCRLPRGANECLTNGFHNFHSYWWSLRTFTFA